MALYEVNGIQYPSVTAILGQLDKSAVLMPWAVKMMGNRIMSEVFASPNPTWNDDGIQWLVDIGKKEYRKASDTAKDIGSEVHDLIKVYIQDGRDAVGKMRPEVKNAFLGFLEWESKYVDKWLESEKKVSHPRLFYAGSLDGIVLLKDGRVVLIDFKTSKGFYDGYAEQLSAYRQAREYIAEHKIESIIYKHDDYKGEMMEFDTYYPPVKIDGMGILRLDKETGLPEFKDYSKQYERKRDSFNSLLDFYYHNKKRRLKNNPRVY